MHSAVLSVWSCVALCMMISSCASRAHLGRETGLSEASPESLFPIAYQEYEQGRAEGVDDSQGHNVVEITSRDRIISAENSHDSVKDEIDQEATFSENKQTDNKKPKTLVRIVGFIVGMFDSILMMALLPSMLQQGAPVKPEQ